MNADNCYGCMINQQNIDHPDDENFFGGHPYKSDESDNTRDLSDIDVDYRFFDPDRDIDMVQLYADRMARMEAIISKFRSERASVNEEGTTCPQNFLKKKMIPMMKKIYPMKIHRMKMCLVIAYDMLSDAL